MRELEALERADALHVEDVGAAQPRDALRASPMQVSHADGALLPPAPSPIPSASYDRMRHVHVSCGPTQPVCAIYFVGGSRRESRKDAE